MRSLLGRLPAGVTVLGPALAVSGLLGYGVFVGAGRILSPADFAVFAGYWGLLFGAGGMLAAAEQETARLVVLGGRVLTRNTRRRLLAVAVGAAVLLLAAGALAAGVVVRHVLHGSWTLFALVAVAVLGFAVQYVVRGAWLGAGRLGIYSALVVAESALRAGALALLVLMGSPGVVACAAAVAVGSFAWIAAMRRPKAASEPVPGSDAEPSLSAVGGKLSRLVVASAFTSAVVTGYPALASAVAPADERATLGVLLAALTVTRLPLLLLGPVQALLVPEIVTRLGYGGWRRAEPFVVRTALVVVAAGTLVAALALPVGSAVVRGLYGEDYRVSGRILCGMTLGATLVAVLLVYAAALVALNGHGWVVAGWAACFVVLLVVLVAPWASFTTRVVSSLVTGPAVGTAVGVVGTWRLGRGDGAVDPAPGSPARVA